MLQNIYSSVFWLVVDFSQLCLQKKETIYMTFWLYLFHLGFQVAIELFYRALGMQMSGGSDWPK